MIDISHGVKKSATVLRHIVMWRLFDPAQALDVKQMLDSCAELVPGILSFEVGLRSEHLEANVDVVLVSTFENTQALEAYQNHPHHKQVAARIGPLREHRYVVDYMVEQIQ